MLTVTNCTFSDNDASGLHGGGIWNLRGTLTVTNSTFSENHAGGAEDPPNSGGGGIGNDGTLTVTNTIVANNTGGDCVNFSEGAAVTDGGHNLIEDAENACGLTNGVNGNLIGVDPMLDPAGLADNGGPTQTIALLPDSPAIDDGDPEVCANPPVNSLDQRGYVRPGVGHTVCSIGAYEADAIPPPPCVGDCDGDDKVAINELILGVNIALDVKPLNACLAFVNSEGMVNIAQLIKAVENALNGCGG
jgi:hypothetical protein